MNYARIKKKGWYFIMPQLKKSLKKNVPTPNVENPPKNSLLGVYNSTSQAAEKSADELAVANNIPLVGKLRQAQSGSFQSNVESTADTKAQLATEKASADFAGFTLDWLKMAAVDQAKYERNHTKDGNEIPTGAYTPLTEAEIQAVEKKALEFASTVPYDSKSPITSMENIMEKAQKDGLVTARSCGVSLRNNKEAIEVAALKTGLAQVKEFREANSQPSNFELIQKALGMTPQGGNYGTVRSDIAKAYATKTGQVYDATLDESPEVAEYIKGMAANSTEAQAFAIGAGKGGYCYTEQQKNPGQWETDKNGVIRPSSAVADLASKVGLTFLADKLRDAKAATTFLSNENISDGLTAVSKAPEQRAERFARYAREEQARQAKQASENDAKKHATENAKRKQIDVSGVQSAESSFDMQAD